MHAIQAKLPVVARVLLGLVFLVFGLNYFFGFLPNPPMSAEAGAFAGALAASKYVFPFIKSVEVASGFALLTNRFVPLALVLLAPIAVNIALFHAFLGGGLALPAVIIALGLFVAWAHRDAYRPLFTSTSQQPGRVSEASRPRDARRATAAA